MRALDGVRVLDLSRFVAGPFCCQILGDNGADVIKVEKPDGEPSRQMPPFARGHSLYFMAYNGSKRSITVNFRSQEGLALLRKLMAKVDVVVENFRAGTMEKMGLGYEAVAAENPGLIMVSISGFGVEGPYADRPAFDEIIQSMSGLASLSGDRDGPPMLTGTYVADFQGIQFLLVDMAADLEAARALVYDVAMRLERDPASRVTTAASLAKLKATDMLMRVAADAIQVVGGFGYTRACPLERVMRDAKCFQIFEGTNQIHRMLIARDLLR